VADEFAHPAVAMPHDISPAAHVVVADLAAPVLTRDDYHHLARVRRMRAGEIVTATDGAGNWRAARWSDGGRLGGDPSTAIEVLGPIITAPAIALLTVGVALTKSDKPEQVVTQLTELGIGRILLITARRSVVKWESDRAAKHTDRLTIAAREAIGQSRGVWLPAIAGPMSLGDAIEVVGLHESALAEPGGEIIAVGASHGPPTQAPTSLFIGPEGGWSDEERAMGLREVALPGNVLRAQTAAVVAATLLLSWHR
jgi:16S rRNA (uracil1498-N3)-methyltransferase